MTQQQLAEAASVSLKTVSNIENESLTPQRGTLRKVRDALGLSSDINVAEQQAAEGVGLERLGFKTAIRQPRSGLDGFLYDMESRMLDLEDRITELEHRLGGGGSEGGGGSVTPIRPTNPISPSEVSEGEFNIEDLYDEPSAAHPLPRNDVEGDVDPDLQ